MDDLIRRQNLLDKFEPWLKVKDYSDGELNMLKAILYEIRFMPSAESEIIRCKDCKHYEYGICKKAGLCVNKSPNGFCDWGERREVTT